ncbi:spore coat protein U domain-containing protein [Deinococcus sp. Leaf326]|uniref:spore coat protein U domain-containing protein n=1 Tax=Deinococcus sp. Leaf326 TaxID=1736338 RepID=UPI0006F3E131|nr:spore coat protein U domain-containing protein [Deinococcus sp. Leaf326]KQQ97731.1 hypothetical protein ASF71_22065 [Deinococcus sp. Leaf326]
MRRTLFLSLLAPTLLGSALAASPAVTSVTVNATVDDICEITSPTSIDFTYQAANPDAAQGTALVQLRCNQDTVPFLGYWDNTQWKADGSLDLKNGNNLLNIVLATDEDATPTTGAAGTGSHYTYGVRATAKPGQWAASNGAYTAVVDYYIGW